MIKYPVTSKSGVRYKVIIAQNVGMFDDTVIRVKAFAGYFLGIERFKTLATYDMCQVLDEYKNDFVKMARDAVSTYEAEVVLYRIKKEEYDANIKKFEEWDGDCN